MSDINNHVDEFLDYYYGLPYSPEYAVLVKGLWGTGKTWFVKKSLDRLVGNSGRYLYISLYGVACTKDIEDMFFQQLHPVLSSKGMQIGTKIIKGFLKTTIKLDIDGDRKDDGSINSQVPDINLPEYLKNTDGFVLVFDDLERCPMDLHSILGYINHFVEHQGHKVIVIANEDEIISKDSDKYPKIKEKLIGKTFEIRADIDNALTSFINEISVDSVCGFYRKEIDTIKLLYNQSKYGNLRHLRQSLRDFERLYQALPESSHEKNGLINDLLKLHLVYSFEIRSGNLKPSEIKNTLSSRIKRLLDSEADSKYVTILKKYASVNFDDPILNDSTWIDFLEKGLMDRDVITSSISNSRYYRSESSPTWVKLWYFDDLTDDEFIRVVDDVDREIKDRCYDDVHIIKHIGGVLFMLAEIGLVKKEKSVIYKELCDYIDYLKDERKLPINFKSERHFIDSDQWNGLGYVGREIQEFKDLSAYLHEKIDVARIEELPNAASDLIELMKTDVDVFYVQLTPFNDKSLYHRIPVLKYIDPSDFLSEILKIHPSEFSKVFYVFGERYKQPDRNLLHDELEWLIKLKDLISIKNDELGITLTSHRLKIMLRDYLEPAIERLQSDAY